jgi:acyl-CoA synthetase (AMP-forming)/AMP-acid ligase II
VTLVNVPLFHVTGEVPVFLQSFALGRKLVLMPKWDATEAMRLIEREKVTYFVGVPLMSFEIATHPDRDKYDLSSCVTFAAGARPPGGARRAHPQGAAAGLPIIGYGLTETNGVGCGNLNENYLAKPDSTGTASRPLVDLAILDDAGKPRPQGEIGEVSIRSVCNFLGYWDNPKATAEAIMPDGYFRTGDLGYLDPEGYLFIVDRKKDIIIRGGENISCIEVEGAITRIPASPRPACLACPTNSMAKCRWRSIWPRTVARPARRNCAFSWPNTSRRSRFPCVSGRFTSRFRAWARKRSTSGRCARLMRSCGRSRLVDRLE